ncbi:MAG: amino acid transporter [Rhodobacterales bacterium]|nr:MAG: amino acid transporter [Rhodobacterales bacterium]
MTGAALTGFFTAFSLIMAIGAQNAFVLRHGILRQHVFALAMFCATSDAVLITAGVLGFGALTERLPILPLVMSLAGAAFLIAYGANRFYAAWRGGHALELEGQGRSLKKTMAMIAVITWANPHVYLDTLGLIGAVSSGFVTSAERLAYALGAISASYCFFFLLAYGARLLAPIMTRPAAWRVLDSLIGITMWAIAAKLLLDVPHLLEMVL